MRKRLIGNNNPFRHRRPKRRRVVTKKAVTISLDTEVYNKLREIAESKECSVSLIVNHCVKAHLPEFVLWLDHQPVKLRFRFGRGMVIDRRGMS